MGSEFSGLWIDADVGVGQQEMLHGAMYLFSNCYWLLHLHNMKPKRVFFLIELGFILHLKLVLLSGFRLLGCTVIYGPSIY